MPKKIGYDIFPGKVITGILSIVSGTLTIVLALILLEGIQILIAMLALLIIILGVFLVIISLRLGKVIKMHNEQLHKLNTITDNRDTLLKLIEEKNIEVDQYKNEMFTMRAQVSLLFQILNLETKPEMNVIKQALRIEYDEVIEDDK